MNVIELKTSDPKRFEIEYQAWANYAADYNWWATMYEDFRVDCRALGLHVDDIAFSGFYSQGDGVAFDGRIYVAEWMEGKGYNITHPAAYIACKEDGNYVRIEKSNRHNTMRVNFDGPSDAVPSGIFAGLDDEAWDELVDDQLCDLNIEDEIMSLCEVLADKLYKDLKAEYEHLTGEEAFIDSCECNEVTFEETEDAIRA